MHPISYHKDNEYHPELLWHDLDRIWYWDSWSTVYESKFVIINDFLFVKVEAADLDNVKMKPIRYFLVLSGPEERTLTHNALLSEKHSVELKLTNDTYESALQIELVDGSKRWLFAHPDGQRAAWQELNNTSSEDDLLRIEDSKDHDVCQVGSQLH